jgi:hypothetical protein
MKGAFFSKEANKISLDTPYVFEPFDRYWEFPSEEARKVCKKAGKFG